MIAIYLTLASSTMGLCILTSLGHGGCCNIMPWRREKNERGQVGERKENGGRRSEKGEMGFGVVYKGDD